MVSDGRIEQFWMPGCGVVTDISWNLLYKSNLRTLRCALYICGSVHKDVLPIFQQSNLIYKFQCRCNATYIGRISHRLEVTVKQHVPCHLTNLVISIKFLHIVKLLFLCMSLGNCIFKFASTNNIYIYNIIYIYIYIYIYVYIYPCCLSLIHFVGLWQTKCNIII